VNEERRERRIIRELFRLLEELLGWFEGEPHLRARILALDHEGNPMTVAPAPFPITDTQSLPMGLALQGSNPNNLTIVSAVWSVDATVTITQTPPALTATAVATVGTDGTANVTAVLTLSDGSTLTTPAFQIAVSAVPVPLSAVIVPGTPTP
jgi:hypothetical protein